MKRARGIPPEPAGAAPAGEPPAVSDRRVTVVLLAIAALTLEGLLESFVLRDRLWGNHFFGFLPPAWTAAALLGLAGAAMLAIRGSAREGIAPRAWLPWAAAAASAALFWILRERHVFWGDGVALVVHVPRGQSFHPDEPLTLWLHHLLHRLFGDGDSAATPIAIGSAAAGAFFTGWLVHWASRRLPRHAWALAAGVLLTQGFTQIFYGHVENYSYLAACLLVFFTTGIDAIEGKGGHLAPVLASITSFAFHVVGALTFPAAALLLVHGLLRPERRRSAGIALAAGLLLIVAGGALVSGLYGGESPLGRVVSGVYKILANPTDARLENVLTWRRAGDVWSALLLLGPLTVPLVIACVAALRGGRFLRTGAGAFLGVGALAFTAPVLLAGPGNLGAARNWDLFAAPAIAPALLAILLIVRQASASQARLLLGLLLATSALHTAPWVALNASFEGTVARIARLPLGNARGETMLGTHYLNAGDLSRAERWFRLAREKAPGNPNAASGLGLALARQNRYEDALPAMSDAVRLKPESLPYRYDIATLLLQLEEWDAAARHLEAIVGLDANNRLAWQTLMHLRLRLGQPDTAAFVAQVGLRHHPGDTELLDGLAQSYAMQVAMHRSRGDAARAAVSLRALESRFPSDPRLAALRDPH